MRCTGPIPDASQALAVYSTARSTGVIVPDPRRTAGPKAAASGQGLHPGTGVSRPGWTWARMLCWGPSIQPHPTVEGRAAGQPWRGTSVWGFLSSPGGCVPCQAAFSLAVPAHPSPCREAFPLFHFCLFHFPSSSKLHIHLFNFFSIPPSTLALPYSYVNTYIYVHSL